MADIVDPATRSRMMSGIRGRDTKPEILIRSLLHRRGFRFRLHVRELPGTPDILLPRWNAALFVNGCFWHGHDCHLFRIPKTREAFWRNKITRNQANDLRAGKRLLECGWRVARVWECAIKGSHTSPEDVADQLGAWLRGDNSTLDIRGREKT